MRWFSFFEMPIIKVGEVHIYSGAALLHLTKISTFYILNLHCISEIVHLGGHFAFWFTFLSILEKILCLLKDDLSLHCSLFEKCAGKYHQNILT